MRAAYRGRAGACETEKARFDTTTGGLAALAGWLAGQEVTLAAMEATGVIRGDEGTVCHGR